MLFLLRLHDPAVWDGLERLARAELRSVNAEIGEYLLRDALAQRGIRPTRAAGKKWRLIPPVAVRSS